LSQEFILKNRRNWKGTVLGYDPIILDPADTTAKRYCLTAPQVEALLGIIEPMAWTTRWISASETAIDTDQIEAFRDDIRKRLMEDCCCDNTTQIVLHRVNPDTGIMEISVDGGDTWTSDPQDPRVTGVALPPPVPAGVAADKCAAAGSITEQFRTYVDEIIAQKTAEALFLDFLLAIAAILIAILAAPVYALFPTVLAPLLTFVFSQSAAAITAAMTTDEYQKFLCAMFCNLQDDGSFTSSGLASARSDALADMTSGIPTALAKSFINGLSLIGMNNAAALGTPSALTCETCDCDVGCSNFEVGNYGANPAFGTFLGFFDGKERYQSEAFSGSENILTLITPDAAVCCFLSTIEIVSGSITGSAQNFIFCNDPQVAGSVNAGDPSSKCINYLGIDSPAAFVIDITWLDCP